MFSQLPNSRKAVCRCKAIGISGVEIEEETDSAYETILDAIVHHDAGVTG